jgi:hypothetical protein
VDVDLLFTPEELAAWRAHPASRAELLARALDGDEQVVVELVQETRGWDEGASPDPFASRNSDERLRTGELLDALLMERAMRAAHEEGILWSPLLQEVIYDGLPIHDRVREEIPTAAEEARRAESDPRRAAFLSELAAWVEMAAGEPDASRLLDQLPEHTMGALMHRIARASALPERLFRWLLERRPASLGALAEATRLTPEHAGVLGAQMVDEMLAGRSRLDNADALRTLRRRGLWTWSGAGADVQRLARQARDSFAAERAEVEKSMLTGYSPIVGGEEWERAERALRERRRAGQSARFLIDQADRTAEGFPGLEALLDEVGESRYYLWWASSSPFLGEAGVRALLGRWRGAADAPPVRRAITSELTKNPAALRLAEPRRWLLEELRDPEMLGHALRTEMFAGEEARLIFRRIATGAPALAGDFLEDSEAYAASFLLRSDLATLLAGKVARTRMCAIQFLGRLEERGEVRDTLPPIDLDAFQKEQAERRWTIEF